MNRETRDWEAHAIIGAKAQGKTSYMRKLADNTYNYTSQKVVVICNTKPPALADLVYVKNPDQLRKRWRGIIRYYNEAGYEQTVEDIVQLIEEGYITNGAVFFDDVTKYIDSNPQKVVKRVLTDHRMRDLDLYFITHGLGILPKFCRLMINTVTTFKTNESFDHPRDLKGLNYGNSYSLYHNWRKVMDSPRVSGYIQPHLTTETGA